MIDLNIVWFVLIAVLFTGYAILDGFDFGVGALHLFVKGDHDRRILLNAIGPVWDGNEVWLVAGGGALFAAFPEAYATVFSGFYLAFMLFLYALIFRAVAIEFRSKRAVTWWRSIWDWAFSLSSIIASLLLGITLGNMMKGLLLDGQHEFVGTFLGLLNPYALLVGVMTLVLFSMHGALYLVLKTDDILQKKLRKMAIVAFSFFILLFIAFIVSTCICAPRFIENFKNHPILLLLPVLTTLIIVNIPIAMYRDKARSAFLSSCLAIVGLMIIFCVGQFPYMVPALSGLSHSLTIYNAASSQKTLLIMLVIAVTGMPLAIGYTSFIYYIFRGKVKLDTMSY